MPRDALLFAAHPDDELLGLGTLLQGEIKKVIYINKEIDQIRMLEASRLADALGYSTGYSTTGTVDKSHWRGIKRMFVPSPSDPHPEHQWALTHALQAFGKRDFPIYEYSIEKNAPYKVPLRTDLVRWKRRTFRDFYLTQLSSLTDPKYFLFEGSAPLGVPDISVSFEEIGFHCWHDAVPPVEYLRNVHRHIFKVKLTLHDLFEADRQQEFHMVQTWARARFKKLIEHAQVIGLSCEEMSRGLAIASRCKYGLSTTVEVTEDGECGAKVRV